MLRKSSSWVTGLSMALGLTLTASTGAAQNSALEFDGLSDHVVLTTSSATSLLNGYTLEAWANSTTSTLAHRILSNFQVAPNRGFGFGIRDTRWRLTTFAVKDYDTAANTMTTGTWTHIAVSLDSSNTARFYVNGAFLTSIANAAGARESTHTLNIGRNPTGAEYWQGRLDEIRIWNTVRSSSDIAKHWNRSMTGTETGLIGYYPFSEGSGSTTADASSNSGDATLVGCTWVDGPALQEPMTDADSSWLTQP